MQGIRLLPCSMDLCSMALDRFLLGPQVELASLRAFTSLRVGRPVFPPPTPARFGFF